MSEFILKSEYFEGPLDILLNLIEKRKLLINHISLSAVTDDFINYLNSLYFDTALKQKSDFIVIASVLMLIKAKSLLPTLELSTEEEVDIASLEKRLKLLEAYRSRIISIQKLLLKKHIYEQGDFRNDIRIFAPSNDINFENIKIALQRVISKIPKTESKLPEVKVRKVISLEEMMGSLSKRIKGVLKMSFRNFAGVSAENNLTKEDKVNVVISFLAMLELVKQNLIQVEQDANFSDINIESLEIDTPMLGI